MDLDIHKKYGLMLFMSKLLKIKASLAPVGTMAFFSGEWKIYTGSDWV